MTDLQKLIEKHPALYFHQDTDSLCVDINEEPKLIEEDATELLENHFEGETIDSSEFTDPDGRSISLTGAEYVKHVGGAVDAFKELGIETW